MSSGGGGGGPTSSTTYTSNLPEYARPYFEHMMERAEKESNQPYVRYRDERIAGFTPDQTTSQQMTRDIAGRPQAELNAATGATQSAIERGQQASDYQSNAIQQSAFGQSQADQYMSPYMQNVIDRQKAAVERDYAEGRPARQTQAIQQGAFGGYRAGIAEGVAQRGLGEKLSDIEAVGRQKAYENAQAQFERDRSASMSAQATSEQQRLAGEQYGLAGASLGLQGAGAMAGIGAQRQGMGLQAANALQAQGATSQQLEQRRLDQAQQDWINQRDWEKNQTAYLSNLLRGVPVQPTTVQNVYSNPNPLAQYGGLGIAGLGLMRGGF